MCPAHYLLLARAEIRRPGIALTTTPTQIIGNDVNRITTIVHSLNSNYLWVHFSMNQPGDSMFILAPGAPPLIVRYEEMGSQIQAPIWVMSEVALGVSQPITTISAHPDDLRHFLRSEHGRYH